MLEYKKLRKSQIPIDVDIIVLDKNLPDPNFFADGELVATVINKKFVVYKVQNKK